LLLKKDSGEMGRLFFFPVLRLLPIISSLLIINQNIINFDYLDYLDKRHSLRTLGLLASSCTARSMLELVYQESDYSRGMPFVDYFTRISTIFNFLVRHNPTLLTAQSNKLLEFSLIVIAIFDYKLPRTA